jgi:hypothetical protein
MKCEFAKVMGEGTTHWYRCEKFDEDCPCVGNNKLDGCLINTCKAERDSLRAALEEIVNRNPCHGAHKMILAKVIREIQDIASKALKENSHE